MVFLYNTLMIARIEVHLKSINEATTAQPGEFPKMKAHAFAVHLGFATWQPLASWKTDPWVNVER